MYFTLNDPYFPTKPVYEYIRYTMTSDNNLNLSYQALDATTYMPLTDKFLFDCKIGKVLRFIAKIYSSRITSRKSPDWFY